ncbi:putative membrane protein [Frankia sp. AiPs1]|uniref:hypothetical protein n=1 Tax=Frankia sp. AiPa1 TaxID=573492 RepID=UPI00202ACEC6|nr:hypothetical protein [Frankia sp. AiPa1]MCL9759033.1 hypothetical protein [Frankia sp. AiPa1]
MERGAASTRGRLIAVWMLLAGLAVMHVLPATATCRETMAGDRTVPASAGMSHHDPAWNAEGKFVSSGTALHADGSPAVGDMGGTPCLSTPPPPDVNTLLDLLVLGLLCVAVPLLPWLRLATGHGPHRRGPPRFGPILLHDLCVSRT